MTNDQLRALQDKAIRDDSSAWWETYGRIWPKVRTKGLITPRRNRLQERIARVIDKMEALGLPVRIIGLKPRQRGSTTFFTGIGYTRMRRRPTSACIIAGEYSQTMEAWQMMQTYHQNDQFKGWNNTGSINEEVGKYTNGSKLKKETAGDKHAGIAGTYQFLHATEVGRWANQGVVNAAEVLANILKCVPLEADTMVVIESTAEGDTGEFPTRWRDAVDADDFLDGRVVVMPGQYVRVFAAWFEFDDSAVRLNDEQKRQIEASLDTVERWKGERDLIADYGVKDETGRVVRLGDAVKGFDVWEQLAWRRQAIDLECKKDPRIFDRDYPHSWEAAFQASGRYVFNKSGLKAMKRRAEARHAQYGVLEKQGERVVWRPTDREEGRIKLWERPLPNRRYGVVVDTMTGASQAAGLDPDCHSVQVWRDGYWEPGPRWVRPAMVARIIPPCRWNIDVLEEHVWRLSCYYGGQSPCIVIPEVNMDRGLIELLKLRSSANIYVREQFNRRESRMETESFGWATTPQTRPMIIEALAAEIREFDTEGRGIDVWDLEAIEEYSNFIQKENGRMEAAAGRHDDDVLCSAIAVQNRPSFTLYSEPIFLRPLPRDIALLEESRSGVGAGGVGRSQFS